MTLDLLIENARIVDGTGSPWFRGAVGVTEGEIDRVVRSTDHGLEADRVVDADGDVVAPGFVDAHSHSDLRLFEDPTLAPKTRQGITTEVVGQDGLSFAPMVVFDSQVVESRATFDRPARHPLGIDHVVVDGTAVVAGGELTGATPGGAIYAAD